jgi:hypothetical protein
MRCLAQFRDHPAAAGQTYVQHLAFAAGFGARMIAGGAAAIVHALVPCWFQTTASRTVRELNAQVGARPALERGKAA